MFNLPKQMITSSQKSPHRSYHLNQTEIRKKSNINKIKEEIEFILKRNNSPLSMNVQKQIQRSQKHIHHHLLERKRSKILQRANEENVQKAKNNRKIYQEYLMGDFAAKSYSKTLELSQQTLKTLTLKQTSYSKEMTKNFSTSKANFNSSRTLEQTKKQKNHQSMFNDKEIQHLGLGKLLFYKDTNVKLKRSNLLNGYTSTEKRNLFKDTAMESFTHESSLDITRYMKHFDKSVVQEDEIKKKQPETTLMRERSLEIFRKDIIPKHSMTPQPNQPKNPEDFRALEFRKDSLEANQQNQSKVSTKKEISPHLNQMNKTLNVLDEELLVYYGKMKNSKPSSHYLPTATHRKSILNRSGSKHNESNGFAKFFEIGTRTSMEIKKPQAKESSWKFQNFDPWQKHKPEDELDHEHVFGNLQEKMNQELFETTPSTFQSLGESQKI